jgi:hypothetical protein
MNEQSGRERNIPQGLRPLRGSGTFRREAVTAGLAPLYDPYLPVPPRLTRGAQGLGRLQQCERRSYILAAIRRLLGEGGCENITMRRIAEASGHAVQTVYNLAGPRNQAISDAISEYSIFVGRTAGAELDASCALPAIVNRWLQAISLTPDFCRQTSLIFFSDFRSIYYRHRDRQLVGLHNLLKRHQHRGIIKHDVDPKALSEDLGLFASAMCLEWSDRPFPLELLHQRLRSGFASMLCDKLTPGHANTIVEWAASPEQSALISGPPRDRNARPAHNRLPSGRS